MRFEQERVLELTQRRVNEQIPKLSLELRVEQKFRLIYRQQPVFVGQYGDNHRDDL